MPPLQRALLLLLLSPACKGDPGGSQASETSETGSGTAGSIDASETADASTTATGLDPDAVTYHSHVRPILARHCLGCHDGTLGALALDGHEAAATLALPIVAMTTSREMPPYPADASGACNTFRDARWLSDEEIATLEAWLDQGTLEGDPDTPAPEIPPPRELTGDVLVVGMPESYAPLPSDEDEYRCFVIDNPAPGGDTFISAYDVHPGDPRVVHHVALYAPISEDVAAQAVALDDAEPGLGYTCYGSAGIPASITAAWAPGTGALHFPPDTGVALPQASKLVLQLHYHTAGTPDPVDRTEIHLEVAPEGVQALQFFAIVDPSLELPPGLASTTVSMTTSLTEQTGLTGLVDIYGVTPHMHTLGRTLDLEVQGGPCLVRTPRWDFDWQLLYFYEQPLTVDAGLPVEMRCTYDTSTRDETTYFGEGTLDEMCVAGLWVAVP